MKLYYLILINIWVIVFTACEEQEREVIPCFYHWQTSLDLSQVEQELVKKLQVKKLYTKFFDVDWTNGAPSPTAEIIINAATLPDSLQIVPTIFITNRTLEKIKLENIPPLARNISKKIKTLSQNLPNFQLIEVQIDCDWSLGTRDKYFHLLKEIRAAFSEKIKLSATIRLHQVKFYKKTGIPPVDRGVLMCYNTGKLKDWNTENSILDLQDVQAYLVNFENYNLPLDLALPIFNWGVVFREERLFKLLNNLTVKDLADEEYFLKIQDNRYELIKSTYLGGHYLYKGDKIRLENIETKKLKGVAEQLKPLLKTSPLHLIFYHLDSTTIKQHPYETLVDIYEIF